MLYVAAFVTAALVAPIGAEQAPVKVEKMEVVGVVGCVRETAPDVWHLEQATDPVPSHANAPSAKEVEAMPRAGKNRYQLIGVDVFNLPAHRGHTVVIKGLEIKAAPVSRLNVTSVTMVAPACQPAAK
jgi:hypothetical protein